MVKRTRTKLSLVAQSLRVTAKCTTADDSDVNVRVMLRYQPQDLKKMIDSTMDPITDLTMAVSSDLARVVKGFEYETLSQASQTLSCQSSVSVSVSIPPHCAVFSFALEKLLQGVYSTHSKISCCHETFNPKCSIRSTPHCEPHLGIF